MSVQDRLSPAAKDSLKTQGLFLLNADQFQHVTSIKQVQFAVDIVAVHGITGNAYSTWTHKNDKLWLRDFLPETLPGARVFTYGYPSVETFTAGPNELSNAAVAFLYELTLQREPQEYKFRPLIFICHSLGGLLVKQLFLTTMLATETYSSVHDSILGIFFLGTPHRASPTADFSRVLVNIADIALASPLKDQGSISKALPLLGDSRSSKALEDLSKQFDDQIRDIKVVSFVEQNTTPGLKRRVGTEFARRTEEEN